MGGENSDDTSAGKRVSKAGENPQVIAYPGEPDHIPQQTGKDTPLHPPGHGVRLY